MFQVEATTLDGAPVEDGEYLLIWTDKNQKQHYVRLITYNHSAGDNELYMDEIYGKENTITYIGYDMLVEDITLDLDDKYDSKFDAIYRKKIRINYLSYIFFAYYYPQ